jgi:hypothetical protein
LSAGLLANTSERQPGSFVEVSDQRLLLDLR